jgi:cytochrome c oxidase subunit II
MSSGLELEKPSMPFHACIRWPVEGLPCKRLLDVAAGSMVASPGLLFAAGGEKNALNMPVGVTDVGRCIFELDRSFCGSASPSARW